MTTDRFPEGSDNELVYRRPFEPEEAPKSRPCRKCAAVGRFTWLDDDGTCRRSDTH